MMPSSYHSSAPPLSAVSATEIEQLRLALALRYPESRGVLGSQLGAFLRGQLTNPDLKRRFGGLKNFISYYFPAEIVWRGRQGLDDLYDISFAKEGPVPSGRAWQPVPAKPSAAFWSAVTNPTVPVQFALSGNNKLLLQAPGGVPLIEGLAKVEKLTKADYQNIATAFVNSPDGIEIENRAQALQSSASGVEFAKVMRERGLLAKWEEFRIDRARRQFADNLAAAGADPSILAHWADILRLSQQEARSRRLTKTSAPILVQPLERLTSAEHLEGNVPDSRALALKAIEFLSESELSGLNLPLGAVMRALGSLRRRP